MIEVNRTYRPDMLETHAQGQNYAELCVTTNLPF